MSTEPLAAALSRRTMVKGAAFGLVALALPSGLAACGSSGTGTAAPSAGSTLDPDTQAKITFAWWGDDDRADRFEQVLGLFNEEYPNIEVVRNFNSWNDYWTARNTEAAGHALPDVVMMDAGYIVQYAQKDLLLDVQPYTESLLDVGEFSDELLGTGTVDDRLVGIPLGTNAWSMMYNKDVLDELGIDYPTADMTWDDIRDLVLAVDEAGSSHDPRIYGAEDYTGGLPGFIYHLMQSGNEVFDADGKPTFDEDDVLDYLQSAKDLRDGGKFYPVDRSVALSPSGGFLAGETALWFNFSTTVAQAMSETGTDNIGVIQPPLENADGTRVLGEKPSMLLSVAANSERADAATALVDFLVNSPDVSDVFGTSLGTPPTAAGRDLSSPSASDEADIAYMESIADELTASYPLLPTGYGTIEAKWGELHEQLKYGDITEDEFVTELFSEISTTLG